MGETITEKILARHCGRSSVTPGEIVQVKVDMVLTHDLMGIATLNAYDKIGDPPVHDPEGVALVMEHVVPSHTVQHANGMQRIRKWVEKQKIKHFYDMGRHGILHAFLPELGLVRPGQLMIGTDSHTCTLGFVGAFGTGVGSTDAAVAMAIGETWMKVPRTILIDMVGKPNPWVSGKDIILAILGKIGADGANYAALEFGGEGLRHLSMEQRATLCNMAIEAGGKNGIIAPDDIAAEWLMSRPHLAGVDRSELDLDLRSDADADFDQVIRFDLSQVELSVALPPSPANVKPLSDIGHIRVDQVFVGTCTNGRIEDLRVTAQILEGQTLAPHIRMIIVPATQQVMFEAAKEGLIQTFIAAGATLGTPGCGPCTALHMGPLGNDEVGLYTSNRNFLGRQGASSAKGYLASPAVAAATAIAGYIASPAEIRPDLVNP